MMNVLHLYYIFFVFLFFFLFLSISLFKPSNYIITIIIIVVVVVIIIIIIIITIMLINITVTVTLEKSNGLKSSKQRIWMAWSTPINQVKWQISPFRGTYRTYITSETELFVILVNSFRPLYNVTKSLLLVVLGVLDLTLNFMMIMMVMMMMMNIIFITVIITRMFEQEQCTFHIR